MHKQLRKPACDAQTAKGNPQKLFTSSFSEHSPNYALFSATYFNILSSIIKITTKWKNLNNRQYPRSKYRFYIVGHKKALKIWCDSPFKKAMQQYGSYGTIF